METDNVRYYALGIEFSMPKSVIEQRILEMSVEEFVWYAKRWIPNPYYPCEYYATPSMFNSREEWEKYEVEGGGHKLLRREGGVKLYWEGTSLKCHVEYERWGCAG